MKNLVIIICLFTFFNSEGQNYWQRYNNEPIKSEITQSTTAEFDTISKSTTKLEYYPNGYLKLIHEKNEYTDSYIYYLYKNDTLQAILTKRKTNDWLEYSYEEVLQNHKRVFPLKTKVLDQYKPYTGENKGEALIKNYSYNATNHLLSVLTEEASYNNDRFYRYYELNYKKKLPRSSRFKVFKITNTTGDSIFDFREKSIFKISSKNKFGIESFSVLKPQDTSHYKTTYTRFSKSELKKKEVDYLTLTDFFSYHLDDLTNKKISAKTYAIAHQKITETQVKDSLSLISERALKNPSWFVKNFYNDYLRRLINNKDYQNIYLVITDVKSVSKFLDKNTLDAFNIQGYVIAKEQGKYAKAKEFFNPLYQEIFSKEILNFEDLFVLTLMSQLDSKLGNLSTARQTSQQIETYKIEHSEELLDHQIADINFLHAQNYFELKKFKKALKLVNASLAYHNQFKDEFGYDYEAARKNEALKEKIEAELN